MQWLDSSLLRWLSSFATSVVSFQENRHRVRIQAPRYLPPTSVCFKKFTLLISWNWFNDFFQYLVSHWQLCDCQTLLSSVDFFSRKCRFGFAKGQIDMESGFKHPQVHFKELSLRSSTMYSMELALTLLTVMRLSDTWEKTWSQGANTHEWLFSWNAMSLLGIPSLQKKIFFPLRDNLIY